MEKDQSWYFGRKSKRTFVNKNKSDGTMEQRVIWYSVLKIHIVMFTTIIYIAVFVQNKIGRETCPYRRKAKDATRELVFIYIK